MNLLFADPAAEGKIKDTDLGEYYPSISGNTYWSSIKPYIKQATIAYLIPLLGDDFYEAMEASSDTKMVELKDRLKGALAYYTIFDAMPHINITIGERGVQQDTVQNATQSPLWAFNQSRWSAMINGDRAMDRAMKYLIDNIADLDEFKDQSEFDKSVTRFFTRDIFSQYTQIDSFRTYMALIPFIIKAENIFLDLNCESQISESLASYSDDKDKELINRVRAAMVEQALIFAIPSLNVYMDKNALMVISSIDGLDNSRVGVFSRENETAVSNLVAQSRADYIRATNRVTDYLYSNKDHFTTFADGIPEYHTSRKITALPHRRGSIVL